MEPCLYVQSLHTPGGHSDDVKKGGRRDQADNEKDTPDPYRYHRAQPWGPRGPILCSKAWWLQERRQLHYYGDPSQGNGAGHPRFRDQRQADEPAGRIPQGPQQRYRHPEKGVVHLDLVALRHHGPPPRSEERRVGK